MEIEEEMSALVSLLFQIDARSKNNNPKIRGWLLDQRGAATRINCQLRFGNVYAENDIDLPYITIIISGE